MRAPTFQKGLLSISYTIHRTSHISLQPNYMKRDPPVSLVGRIAIGSASSVFPDLVTQAT